MQNMEPSMRVIKYPCNTRICEQAHNSWLSCLLTISHKKCHVHLYFFGTRCTTFNFNLFSKGGRSLYHSLTDNCARIYPRTYNSWMPWCINYHSYFIGIRHTKYLAIYFSDWCFKLLLNCIIMTTYPLQTHNVAPANMLFKEGNLNILYYT